MPTEMVGAARLDAWLLARCRTERMTAVPVREIQRYGPPSLREKSAIDEAMVELEDLGRAYRFRDGKKKLIAVNPQLLEVAS